MADTGEVERRLDQLDALRRRVINVVGHELRTPVTTMRGLADELVAAESDDKRELIADALQRSARRVEQLLDDLLVAADITTAMPVGPHVSVPLAIALRAAWDELEEPAADLAIAGDDWLRASMPSGSVPRILRQVLDNTAKYGDRPARAVLTAVDERLTRIDVVTPGASVTAIDIALAFEPFYRGEAAVTTGPGLGLGLTVARSLVEQVGGTLSMRMEDGAVVTTIELPRA